MTYLKSYGQAVYHIGGIMGLIFLIMSFFTNVTGASFFVYLILAGSIAGPLGIKSFGEEE